MKKIRNILLCLTMVFTLLCINQPVYAASDNIALNKTASASSVYPNSGKTADKAVDGIVDDKDTKVSRWSSKRLGVGSPTDQYDPNIEQWLLVDLGEKYSVSQVNIFWEGALATSYKIQGSLDGVNFFDIATDQVTNAGLKKKNDFNKVETNYIRILCQTAKNNSWGYSIYELEVYQQKQVEDSSDVIHLIEEIAPTLSEDGKSIVLPSIPKEYEIYLYGSDNQQVINQKGKIIQPLVDMDVNVTYKVVKKDNPKDVATSSKDAKISIDGKYKEVTGDNAKPNVVPGLREWKGAHGQFELNNSSRIVYQKESQKDAALMIQSYFKDMLEHKIDIVVGNPKSGDIYLESGSTIEEVGKEGYYLFIDDYVTIKSLTYKGMIYGGTSITQILYQDSGWDNAPKGIARDYPQYEVRAGMIDVGRMYIPMEYLQEMTTYMSWFKMNEAHIHINDYWGGSDYSAFRLESEVYPSVNAKDGYYTKKEYRQFQKDMKKHGMNIITEIDTPYHSEAFKDIPGVVMSGKGSLDIRTPEAFAANQKIIENLFDEYLDGDDPVIQSDSFHIGTDEYDKKYSEQMRQWTDHFINYVNDKGYQSRAWASLGSKGFNGTTPVSKDAVMNLWAPYWADVKETYEAGYDIVNTEGGWLYIVPAGNAGYPDRYDTKKIYERFEVNNFQSDRSGTNGTAIMPVSHPQTKGASFAIWNDMTSFRTGFSWFDIYDRMKDAVSVVAEKTWFGEDEAGQTYDQFRKRIDALQNKAPNTNPGRFVETKGSKVIADYDLKTVNETVKDLTDNHYDAKVKNGEVVNGELRFEGDGYMSLPMQSIGYPYTVTMNLKLDEITENTTLFAGKDGTLYADINGKVGYKRGAYAYTFDYTLKPNQETILSLVCDQKNLTLFINGRKIGNGKLTNATIGGKTQHSSTFVLPVEKIFENATGSLINLKLYNQALSESDIKEEIQFQSRDNLALNKTATASALEVNNGKFTADMAVDGIVSKDSRVSFARANEQWLLINLGKEEELGGITINYESVVGKYEIQVSNNGTDFTTIYTKNEESVKGAFAKIENIDFQPTKARYVRYVQKEMWEHASNGQKYSGSIYEFEIHKPLSKELLESVEMVENKLKEYTPGTHNGNLDINYYNSLKGMLDSYRTLANSGSKKVKLLIENNELNQESFEVAKTRLYKEVTQIDNHILFVKQDAVDEYEKLKSLDYHNYTVASYKAVQDKLSDIKDAIDATTRYQEVNDVLEIIKETSELLVKVDNSQLVDLIKTIDNLDLTQYIDTEDMLKILDEARNIYENPVSQKAINDVCERLKLSYQSLEKKQVPNIDVDPIPEDKPDTLPDKNPIETGDNQMITLFAVIGTLSVLGVIVLKKKKES